MPYSSIVTFLFLLIVSHHSLMIKTNIENHRVLNKRLPVGKNRSKVNSSKNKTSLIMKSSVKKSKFDFMSISLMMISDLSLLIIQYASDWLIERYFIDEQITHWTNNLRDVYLVQREMVLVPAVLG